MEYCKINKINCLGICWGGFAILKKFNVEKFTEKLLGLFSKNVQAMTSILFRPTDMLSAIKIYSMSIPQMF